MLKPLSWISIVAICMSAIGVLVYSLRADAAHVFKLHQLKVIPISNTPVGVSTILPEEARYICVLSSYQDPKFLSSIPNASFLMQADQSSVPEGAVRITTFGPNSKLLHELDIPMWRGKVRITVDSDIAFCKGVDNVRVKLQTHDKYKTVQFWN